MRALFLCIHTFLHSSFAELFCRLNFVIIFEWELISDKTDIIERKWIRQFGVFLYVYTSPANSLIRY